MYQIKIDKNYIIHYIKQLFLKKTDDKMLYYNKKNNFIVNKQVSIIYYVHFDIFTVFPT